jgi:transcriptional regulator of acetoin/glycerol metabolism
VKYEHSPDVSLIRRAYGTFIERGAAPEGVVPAFIENSWARSHRAGVDSDRVRELGRLTDTELLRAEEEHVDFVTEAAPVMENLFGEIASTGSIVLLCGADGLILKSMGDPEFLERAERVALAPGVSWSEETKGTNAIGTAIIERSPVIVYAAQHYVQHHHFLTCSASPILDAHGRVAGVLDITGDYRSHQAHTIALVKMSAQVIERQLFRRQYRNDVVLRVHSRPNYLGSIYDGQIAFSLDGNVLAANSAARSLLRLPDLGPPMCFHDLFGTHLDHALAEARWGDRGMCSLRLRDGSVAYLQIDVAPLPRAARGRPITAESDVRRRAADPTSRAPQALEQLDLGDPAVRAMLDRARRVVGRDIPILIEGETGTGKEWLARALHAAGPRAAMSFVAVNCAAIPEGLIESELFGYDEGAFTGARRKGMVGRVFQAHGGTLFLDEIGDMPFALQTRLLRVLQERAVSPLGASRPIPVDIAVVCATHRNLRGLVSAGQFREDLYYRLNGIALRLPPLRERADLPALVQRILESECPDGDLPRLDESVVRLFATHPWPGNVRQLHSVLRTALALMPSDGVIRTDCLPDGFADDARTADEPALDDAAPGPVDHDDARGALPLAELELRAIRDALAAHDGNVSAAARALGIGRNTLYRKLGRA